LGRKVVIYHRGKNNMNISTRKLTLRQLRDLHGFTQMEVAREMQRSQSWLSIREMGYYPEDAPTIRQIIEQMVGKKAAAIIRCVKAAGPGRRVPPPRESGPRR
jgi:predicted transcriptional regulator